jgi:hypothetical protein
MERIVKKTVLKYSMDQFSISRKDIFRELDIRLLEHNVYVVTIYLIGDTIEPCKYLYVNGNVHYLG